MHPDYPKVPDIKSRPPGPRAQELIETDERYVSPSYTRSYPLAVKCGQGTVIEDMDEPRSAAASQFFGRWYFMRPWRVAREPGAEPRRTRDPPNWILVSRDSGRTS